VAVVSEVMARTLWPDGDGLGECLLLEVRSGVLGQECTTVVGVAEDAARDGFQNVPGLAFYLPLPQTRQAFRALYIRAEGGAESVMAEVATLFRSYSPLRLHPAPPS